MEVILRSLNHGPNLLMGYVKRKCSNAGKVSLLHFAEIKEVFLADIQAMVLMNEIPDELIVNWDQTGIQLAPTGDWTMNRAGAKVIPIHNSDDKRQITAVLSASLSGEYLAPQLLYQGKTDRCHPKVTFPEGWDVWHSENHWSNEDTMKRYIERIIIPFLLKSVKYSSSKKHTLPLCYLTASGVKQRNFIKEKEHIFCTDSS